MSKPRGTNGGEIIAGGRTRSKLGRTNGLGGGLDRGEDRQTNRAREPSPSELSENSLNKILIFHVDDKIYFLLPIGLCQNRLTANGFRILLNFKGGCPLQIFLARVILSIAGHSGHAV
jgi:hypothetical protein